MKKLILSIMLVLGLSVGVSVKAEEVNEEIPTEEVQEEVQEEKSELELKLEEIQSKLEKIENGLTAEDIDNSTPVKWLENKMGISLEGLGAFILGSITALLLLVKVARSLSKLIDKDNKLSESALKELQEYSKEMVNYKKQLDEVVKNNNKLNDDFKKSWEEVSVAITNLQEFLSMQKDAFKGMKSLLEESHEE